MDKESTEAWKTWLKSVPEPEQKTLLELLRRGLNGKSPPPSETPSPTSNEVIVTRTPVADLLIDEVPPYVDIFGLHAIFQRVAFECNTLLKGPKGIAKTLAVLAYAHAIKCPVVIQESSEDTKKYELMGSQMLLGDNTVYILGSIPTAIDVANEVGQCILLFEELNALTNAVQKQLNAIADFRKMVSLPHIGRTFKLRKGAKIWLVGTMNPSTYAGSYDLNEDLKSRFSIELDLTYPEHGQEKQAVKASCPTANDGLIDSVLRFAKETRQQATGYALSTRDVVELLKMMAIMGLDTSLQIVLGKFEDADKDLVLKRMASVFGPKPIKKFWGQV